MPSLRRPSPVVRGAAVGVAAYLLGYLVTYAWLGGRVSSIATDVTATVSYRTAETSFTNEPLLSSLLERFGGVSSTTWAGWLFYNAHGVPFSVRVPGRGTSGSVPNLLLAADDGLLPLLFVVPPLLLVAAGAVLARDASAVPAGSLPAGAGRGATVVAGYLPLSVAGALVFTVPGFNPMNYGNLAPHLLGSVLVMGGLYPLVFGGLGGWVVTRVRAARSDDGRAEADIAS